jgi:hypothetical protein
MFRRLGLLFAALALFAIAGGHWAVLQSVAWGQMLRDYSRRATLVTAVEKTFSGKYPCGMCRRIADAQKKEEKRPAIGQDAKKAEIFLTTTADDLAPPVARRGAHPAFRLVIPESRADAPPTPVPIVVA